MTFSMEDIDKSGAVKKVCRKRVNESSNQINPHGDAVLVSDDSVADSPVCSVDSISVDSTGDDPMVPITPSSECHGVVDHFLDLDDSPLPIALPNEKFLDCEYKCKGGGFLKRKSDSSSLLALPNQMVLDCDRKCKGRGFVIRESDSLSAISSSNQQLRHCDYPLKNGGFFSEDNPCTPKKNVFDPFAPGPEKLNLAPHCRKYTENPKLSVARKLKFDLCTKFDPNTEDQTVSEDEMLVQSVYSDIMETIFSIQKKELGKVSCEHPLTVGCLTPIVATKENVKVSCELYLSDGCRTPVGAPRLSGVADVCPGAPVKGSHKIRRIDKKICRKLEF